MQIEVQGNPEPAPGIFRMIAERSPGARPSSLGTSGLFLAGCTPARPTIQAPLIHMVATLFENDRFIVAHRGSGDNWPEHTMHAYEQSVNSGVPALEVSVNATKDGVLVCHHDQSALRVTGQDRKVAELTYAELSGLRVDARAWLGPSTAPGAYSEATGRP